MALVVLYVEELHVSLVGALGQNVWHGLDKSALKTKSRTLLVLRFGKISARSFPAPARANRWLNPELKTLCAP
eukprot:4768003-Amphidinium_carterae.1